MCRAVGKALKFKPVEFDYVPKPVEFDYVPNLPLNEGMTFTRF